MARILAADEGNQEPPASIIPNRPPCLGHLLLSVDLRNEHLVIETPSQNPDRQGMFDQVPLEKSRASLRKRSVPPRGSAGSWEQCSTLD